MLANRSDRMNVRFGDGEIWLHRQGPLQEKGERCILQKLLTLDRLQACGKCQWRNRKLMFSLEVQIGAARYQDLQIGTGEQQCCEVWRGLHHLLKIIEDQQELFLFEIGLQILHIYQGYP